MNENYFAVPPLDKFPWIEDNINPGHIIFGSQDCITLNSEREAVVLSVVNTGDRPIQVLVTNLSLLVLHFTFFLIIQ